MVWLALSSLVAGFYAFWGLGSSALRSWDEGLYAKIALDMLGGKEWLVYLSDGHQEISTFKPPLLIYLQMGAFSLLGPTEFATRLPAAASFVLLAVATTAWCDRVLERTTSVLVLIVLVTSQPLLFDHFARHGAPDAPLALFQALTVFSLWPARAQHLALRAAVPYSGALLAKGIAALPLLPVIAIWYAVRRAWSHLACVALGLACAVLPTVLWLVARERRAPGFIDRMVELDLLGRLDATMGAAPYDPLFYWKQFADDFFRIGLVLLVLALVARRAPPLAATMREPRRRNELLILLVAWTLVPMGLFSFARTQHTWYALPSYVPACILAAWCGSGLNRALVARVRVGRRQRRLLVAGSLLAVALVVGGKTNTRLMRVAGADPYSSEVEAVLAMASNGIGRPVVFPAWDLPALRFYLTRSAIRYEAAATPGALRETCRGKPRLIISTTAHEEVMWDALGGRGTPVFRGVASELVVYTSPCAGAECGR